MKKCTKLYCFDTEKASGTGKTFLPAGRTSIFPRRGRKKRRNPAGSPEVRLWEVRSTLGACGRLTAESEAIRLFGFARVWQELPATRPERTDR